MCGGPGAMDQALRAYRERCRGAYRGLGPSPTVTANLDRPIGEAVEFRP